MRTLGRGLLLALLVLLGPVAAARARAPLRVAAASSLRSVLPDLLKAFEEATGLPVVPTYGSSGALASQILQGAPYDLFLSADDRWVRVLVEAGAADPEGGQVYALGRLALALAPEAPTDLPLEDLLGSADRIALANPRTAPYGRAARQVLEGLGLWAGLQDRLLYAGSVAQVLEYVRRGEARIGFVAYPQARPFVGEVRLLPLDPTLHDPLLQVAVVPRGAPDPEGGQLLRAFLTTPRAREILAAHGYDLPSEEDGAVSDGAVLDRAVLDRPLPGGIWEPLWISLQAAAGATLLAGLAGLALALALRRRRWPGREGLIALGTLPLVLPPAVVGYGLLVLLGRRGPLGGLGIPFTLAGAAVAAGVVAFPLAFRTALAALEEVDPALEEVARTLGSGRLRVLATVTLPLARRGLLAGLALTAARALGEFGATLILAGNLPGRTQTLPLAVYDAVEAGDGGTANRLAGLALGLSLFLLWGVRRWERELERRRRG